ncbi:MAG: elongation factor P [Planctomycetaceae bacterium]
MPSINVGEFRKGMKVLLEGQPCEIMSVDFKKPGKGQAVYTTKLRNLLNGKIYDFKYRSGESLESADIRNSDGMYSYYDGTNYIFMDNESFEQVGLSAEVCGDQMTYIPENTECGLLYWNNQLIAVSPPKHIVLEVTYTEPAARGDTATNVTKAATVATGGTVQVPAFIAQGNRIKIDTESGSYIERVND